MIILFVHGIKLYANIDGSGYRRRLETWLHPQLRRFKPFNYGLLYFQQDGETPHTSKVSIEFLQEIFPGKSRRGDMNWPARSPDLTPLDFWLWGDIKSKVYATPIPNLEELRRRIDNEISAIPAETRRNAIAAFRSRMQCLLEVEGRHVE